MVKRNIVLEAGRKNEGKEMCQHIRYPDYKETNEFCADLGIEFLIK